MRMITVMSTNNRHKLGALLLAGLGGVFGKDLVEGYGKKIRVGPRENQRGTQLDDVVMRPVCAGQDATLAQAVDDVRGLLGSGFAGRAIENQVHAEKKSQASHIAN